MDIKLVLTQLLVWIMMDFASSTDSSMNKARRITKPPAPAPVLKGFMAIFKPVDDRLPKAVINPQHPPYNNQPHATVVRAIGWLTEFGYMLRPTAAINSGRTQAAFRRGLLKMQQYANISVTGILDTATVAKISTPRCGQKDFITNGRRHRRYILVRRRWPRNHEIDVQFANYTRDMTVDEQEAVMSWAVDEWADAADIRLNFHPQGSHIPNPEINIYHTRYDAKGKPFRRYGILAYAALPTNGDMFFDDTEFWAEYHSKHPQRFSYRTVALHEMGHSLGFAHSDVPSAVMYSYYGPNRHQLTPDDIAGMENMFGPA